MKKFGRQGGVGGASDVTSSMQKEVEHLVKTGEALKYSIVRGDKDADLRSAYQSISEGKTNKTEAIKIAIENHLIKDDDNVTVKKAMTAIENYISKSSSITIAKAKKIKSDDLDLSKKEDRLKLIERKKKAQYSNDAYTGNGTQKPSQFNNPLETEDPNPRERYLVPNKFKDVQPKSDIREGEEMEVVPPAATTDSDKEIQALEAKLEAAKQRKANEDSKKLDTIASLIASLNPESLAALKDKLSPEKKTELKVDALDKPHRTDDIVETPAVEKSVQPPANVNMWTTRMPSANPTMSQDLQNPSTGNSTMSQDVSAIKKEAQVHYLYLNVYDLDQAYGGPEEGGWYYQTRNPIHSQQIPANTAHDSVELMKNHLKEEYHADENDAKTRYKVNGGPDRVIRLESEPATGSPQFKPRYESKKKEKQVKSKYRPIRNIIAQKECVEEIIDLLNKQKSIEDIMAAQKMLEDGIIPSEHLDRAIEVYTTDKDGSNDQIKKQIDLLKDSLKLKARFINDAEKKSESHWVVKNTKNEPIFKVTASQAFGVEILKNWDMFKSEAYGKKLVEEMEKHGVMRVISSHYPEATIFDEGLKNMIESKKPVIAQVPMQTDTGVSEPNVEVMEETKQKPSPVEMDLEKELSKPALVDKEVSDELLAPTEKTPHIADLLVEILSPMILGSDVNTPESIIQDLKALFRDDESMNIFLGKIKQKVYELGNAHEENVPQLQKEEKKEDVGLDQIKGQLKTASDELSKKEATIVELNKKIAETGEANKELKETLKKIDIERSAKLRAERAKRLSDLRAEIGIEDKDTTSDLMKMSSKEFLSKEEDTIKMARKLRAGKRNAFITDGTKLWSKGSLPGYVSEEKQPSLIGGKNKLEVGWNTPVKKVNEE